MESRSRRAGPSRSLPASGGEWTFGPLLARPDWGGENAFCGRGSVRAQRTFAFSSFRLLLSDRRLLCVRHADFCGQLFDEGEPPLRQLVGRGREVAPDGGGRDRKSTRLNSSHGYISYAVFCLKKKKKRRSKPRILSVSER